MPNERDRQKVVVQITQNLSSRVRNAHAFELPSLYIPSFAEEGSKASRIDNSLELTCEQMQQTISQNAQPPRHTRRPGRGRAGAGPL